MPSLKFTHWRCGQKWNKSKYFLVYSIQIGLYYMSALNLTNCSESFTCFFSWYVQMAWESLFGIGSWQTLLSLWISWRAVEASRLQRRLYLRLDCSQPTMIKNKYKIYMNIHEDYTSSQAEIKLYEDNIFLINLSINLEKFNYIEIFPILMQFFEQDVILIYIRNLC